MLPAKPRYRLRQDVWGGCWIVMDRLTGCAVFLGRSVIDVTVRARDEEDDWRRQCQRWIEQEEQS